MSPERASANNSGSETVAASAQPSMSTDAIEKATGRPWAKWRELLDTVGAAKLGHQDLAALVLEHMPDIQSKHWWAQSVAISYEQATGTRVPGQLSDGTFAANASRTLTGTMDEVLERWVAYVGAPDELNGVPLSQPPSTSSSEKWRYWRCTLGAGQRINVTINEKPGGKATLAVQHPGLGSTAQRDEWKAFWRDFLKALPA